MKDNKINEKLKIAKKSWKDKKNEKKYYLTKIKIVSFGKEKAKINKETRLIRPKYFSAK